MENKENETNELFIITVLKRVLWNHTVKQFILLSIIISWIYIWFQVVTYSLPAQTEIVEIKTNSKLDVLQNEYTKDKLLLSGYIQEIKRIEELKNKAVATKIRMECTLEEMEAETKGEEIGECSFKKKMIK